MQYLNLYPPRPPSCVAVSDTLYCYLPQNSAVSWVAYFSGAIRSWVVSFSYGF